jgi:hypothetical protein
MLRTYYPAALTATGIIIQAVGFSSWHLPWYWWPLQMAILAGSWWFCRRSSQLRDTLVREHRAAVKAAIQTVRDHHLGLRSEPQKGD